MLLAASATIGALFGTPVAAALVFTGLVAAVRAGGSLWDKLFLPLAAAGAASITMHLLGAPPFAFDVPAYGPPQAFDILTGASALVLWVLHRRGGVSPSVLRMWNTIGLALLVTIVTLAVLSFPKPFGLFTPQNQIVAYFPWVWLPTFLVQLALLGHLLMLRKLRTAPGRAELT